MILILFLLGLSVWVVGFLISGLLGLLLIIASTLLFVAAVIIWELRNN